MIHFAADQDFDMGIIRGLRHRITRFTVVHVSEVGLSAADDSELLDWAAKEGRIDLTHDARSLSAHAYGRLGSGMEMPGLFIIPRALPIGKAILELELIVACSEHAEWDGQVNRLPL